MDQWALRGGWQHALSTLATAVRRHLGLIGGGAGLAHQFDELAKGLVDRQMSGSRPGPASRSVTVRLRVRQSTARQYRWLEKEAARYLPRDVSFIEYACLMVWQAWRHLLDPQVAYAEIFARDRHRCLCPVCGRRDVTGHHFEYRSRGGSDADENVGSICAACHLELIHGGFIQVLGPASRPTWRIGRAGGLRVVGRELAID